VFAGWHMMANAPPALLCNTAHCGPARWVVLLHAARMRVARSARRLVE